MIKNKSPRLLDLPGELRNMIYEYAVSSTTPLRCIVSDDKPTIYILKHNPLKHVNRQLYYETKALVAPQTELLFCDHRYRNSSGIDQFVEFLQHCAPKHYEKFGTITIKTITKELIADVYMSRIDPDSFSNMNQHALVKLRASGARSSGREVLLDAIFYAFMLRRNNALSTILPTRNNVYPKDLLPWNRGIELLSQPGLQRRWPENWRFYPWGENIDVGKVVRFCKDEPQLQDLLPSLKGGVWELIEVIKQAEEEGL